WHEPVSQRVWAGGVSLGGGVSEGGGQAALPVIDRHGGELSTSERRAGRSADPRQGSGRRAQLPCASARGVAGVCRAARSAEARWLCLSGDSDAAAGRNDAAGWAAELGAAFGDELGEHARRPGGSRAGGVLCEWVAVRAGVFVATMDRRRSAR